LYLREGRAKQGSAKREREWDDTESSIQVLFQYFPVKTFYYEVQEEV